MIPISKLFGAIAGALFLTACQTIEPAKPTPAALAIGNVTVIDPASRRVLPRHTIYIAGDTIIGIRPAHDRSFVAARSIDASGKFAIPGLTDMHVHLFLPEPAKPTLNLLLANGVTGIREMSSDCQELLGAKRGCVSDYRALQAALAAGELAGPEILALTSNMVMGPSRMRLPAGAPSFVAPRTAADARALVQHIGTRSVNLIKTHDSVPSAAFVALMEEAGRMGLPVGGHVPFAAGSLGAARLGYRSIEHARDLLYDCSRFGAEFRRREAAFADEAPGSQRPSSLERLRRTVAEFDAAMCERVLAELAQTEVYYVPTHVTREMEARARDLDYRSDPARKYIGAERNARWEADLKETAGLPDEENAALGDFFRHGLLLTRLAHQAGIPVMAGTDASDTMMVPGFSLHRELHLLRLAGLSSMDVLRSATTVPAQYFGGARFGALSAGKEADIVLLTGNPLEDIANTRSIAAVVSNGRLFDRQALDVLLAEVETIAAR